MILLCRSQPTYTLNKQVFFYQSQTFAILFICFNPQLLYIGNIINLQSGSHKHKNRPFFNEFPMRFHFSCFLLIITWNDNKNPLKMQIRIGYTNVFMAYKFEIYLMYDK